MDTGKKQRKGKKRKMNEKGHLKKCIVGTAVVLGMLTILTAVFIRRSLTADASDSVIFVSMEGDSFDQKFFRGTTDMVVTIRERLFDSSTLSILIQDETGREARITYDEERKAWEGLDGLEGAAIEAAAYETETGSRFLFDSEEGKETYTEKRTIEMKFRFSGEGTYIIREIACDDLAGNHSALEKPVSFTIDKTAPLMEILLPPEEEKGRAGYYSTPVTVWLYLKEHNFSTEERAEKPEIFLMNGEKEEMVSAKDITWKAAPEKGEDWYKASVMCTGDASYGLRVSYKDPAGWEPAGESKTECGFTVDTTPPDYGTVTAMGQSWDSFWIM